MIVLGVLFVVVAVGFGAGVLLDNGEAVSLQWYGLTLDGFTGLSTYVAGLVTMLVLLVGLWLVRRGVGRRGTPGSTVEDRPDGERAARIRDMGDGR